MSKVERMRLRSTPVVRSPYCETYDRFLVRAGALIKKTVSRSVVDGGGVAAHVAAAGGDAAAFKRLYDDLSSGDPEKIWAMLDFIERYPIVAHETSHDVVRRWVVEFRRALKAVPE